MTDALSLFDLIDQQVYWKLKDLPVKIIPHTVRNELAKVLNCLSRNGTDWRNLAQELGFSFKDIRYIMSLNVRCFFLEMLDQSEEKTANKIGNLIEALHSLGRNDALAVFRMHHTAIAGINIFVTYAYNDSNIKYILQVRDNMINNGIFTKLDEKSQGPDVPEKTMERFRKADYILVCITDTYTSTIAKPKSGKDVNTAAIYKEMVEEYTMYNMNKRAIPLLLPGATNSNIPEWMCNSGPGVGHYKWPEQYKELLRCMKKKTVTSRS